jgi:GH35 family endo-1,4-beta-xylanase
MPLRDRSRLQMKYLIASLSISIAAYLYGETQHEAWDLEGADQRIRAHRMGTRVLELMLPDGRPVPLGTDYNIEQMNHAFQFGGSLAADWKVPEKSWYPAFKSQFARLFNYATIDFYWSVHAEKQGEWHYNPESRAKLDWAKAQGMTLRGHPLMWHEVLPAWMRDSERDVAAIDADITQHVDRLLREYPEIDEWDVYNEAIGIKWRPEEEGIRRWHESVGGASLVSEKMLKLARAREPNKRYILNHYTDLDKEYEELIEHCLKEGADFEAIGIQTHMHTLMDSIDEDRLWQALEKYSRFGKPIHLSEISILSCERFKDYESFNAWKAILDVAASNREPPPTLPSTAELELYQAELARDFYTLAFSHPAVEAIIWWTITDLEPWRGMPAGLLDAQGKAKPVYKALDQLINEAWRTRKNGLVAEGGNALLNGFFGEYRLTVEVEGEIFETSFELAKEQKDTLYLRLNKRHEF